MSYVVCQMPVKFNYTVTTQLTFVNQTYNLIKEKPEEDNLTRTTFSEITLNDIALFLAHNSMLIEC